MKSTLLCLALLGGALAVPNGYYHQEYNYKTSSSSFKNNELQHKTDDQGYYRKDGDLEGRTRPRVDSNSEHAEYVNPSLRSGNQYGYGGYGASDLTSNGHMLAQNSYGALGSNQLTEGLASRDHIKGYSSGNTYGSGQSYSASSTANLRTLLSQLQSNMEQDLLDSIRDNNYGYSTHRNTIEQMERELRRNMSERIDNELLARYGQQTIRGGQAYSISNGRIQNTANYNDVELAQLKTQMENSLLDKLRRQYGQGYSTNTRYDSHAGSSNRYQYSYTSTTTARPVYATLYPTLTTPRQYDNYYQDTNRNQYPSSHSNIRYTPVSNPESITNIASTVQSRLDATLNEILSEAQRKYSSGGYNTLTNFDVILDRLREELRSNITYMLDENIRRNYGNQELRDGYYYTTGSNGQISSQSNYAASDLDNVRSQVERNLIEKLNRDFETYRSRWSQTQSWNSHSNYDSDYGTATHRYVYTTPRYVASNQYTTPRYQTQYGASSSNLYGESSSNLYGGASSNLYGESSGGYGVKGSGSGGSSVSSSSSIAQLQSRLQNDLSRQLQQALTQQQRTHDSYSASSGVYNPETYDSSLQRLSDEMNRNITRNIQQYSASGSYGAYGDYSEAQMAALKSQLESNLMRQLQQGLQQSFQTHQSYSSSSSGSYNRPVRGFQNYQHKSGLETMEGEDCQGAEPNALNNHRTKRSSGYYRSRPLNIGGHSGYSGGYSGSYYGGQTRYTTSTSSRPFPQEQEELGQQIEDDDSDLAQQVEDSEIGNIGQQEDNSDLTQQVEDSGFSGLELKPQHQKPAGQRVEVSGYGKLQVGQQEDDSDLNQQVEDFGYGELQVGNQNRHPVGQQEDLNQQVEDLGFRKLQVGSQQPYPMGQAVDHAETHHKVENSGIGQFQNQHQYAAGQAEVDSDLTQQLEDSSFGKIEVDNLNQAQTGQHGVRNNNQQQQQLDLTQQVEDSGLGKLQIDNQAQVGQHQLHSDLTLRPQVQDSGFGKLEISNQNQAPKRQYQLDSDLTQQVEDTGFGKLQLGHQNQVQVGQHQLHSDLTLTQQAEDSGFGKLQIGNQYQSPVGQQEDTSDLTQQVEEFGNLNRKPVDEFSYLGHPDQEPVASDASHPSQNQGFSQTLQKQHNYQSTVGFTQEVHHTSQGTTNVVKPDLDEIVNKLERTLSIELQRIVDSEKSANGKPDIPEIVKVLQAKITVPGRLSEEQLLYVTKEVQNYMAKEIRKHFGDEYNYSIRWGTSSSTVPNSQNIFVLEGFHTEKFSDFTSSQIDVSQSIETTLSLQLKLAIQHIETGLSNAELRYQKEKLVEELLRNVTRQISHLPPEQSTLFTTLQIQRIRNQLEKDLKQQLDQELDKLIVSHNIGQENQEDVIHTGISSSPKPSNPQSHVLEPVQSQSSNLKPKSWNINGFTEKQVHFSQYLEDTFTKQLNEAIDIEYTFNYSPKRKQPEIIYQQLLKDLERNVTTRIEAYSQYFLHNYMTFTTEQLESIKSQLLFNLELKLRKQLALDNGRGDMRPDEVGPKKPDQDNTLLPQFPTTQPEIQEEVGQQQEEIGQQEIEDSFEKVEPVKPLDQAANLNKNPNNQRPTQLHEVSPQFPPQNRPYDDFGQPQLIPQTNWKTTTTRSFVSSNQFLQTEIEQQQSNINNQAQFNQRLPNTNNNQPDTGVQFGITSQGQIITREQTRVEAENNADALVNLLRNKQTLPQLKPVEENSNPSYHYRPAYGGNTPEYQPNIPNDNRPAYGSHTPTYGGHISPNEGHSTHYGNYPLHYSQSVYPHLSYGHQETLDEPQEHTSDLTPLRPAQAHEVTHVESSQKPNYYIGVKGRPRHTTPKQVYVEEVSSPSSVAPLEIVEESTLTPTEELPWWKKFGNKVKEGASKLKEKIGI